MPPREARSRQLDVRTIAERLAATLLRRSGSPYRLAVPDPVPRPDQPPATLALAFARELHAGSFAHESMPVTHVLFERLDEGDVAEVVRRLPECPELQAHYAAAPNDAVREMLILIAGAWLRVASVLEKTGLSASQPPQDVHAMARGPLAAGGGFYEANLVAAALASVGVKLASLESALDFGCSSARVLRALVPAHPQIAWHGCDPNAPAIAWAAQQLPGANLFVSADAPPLALQDGSLDLIYAISIWSHFAPELGLRWFEEMRRLLRPGGHLVCTTHGLTSVAYYAIHGHRAPEQSWQIAEALYRRGWWYAPEFGETGDWGVVNPDWGTAFLSPEWLLAQLCPRWRVLEFAAGRNQGNQDVYVLQRV